MRLIDADALSRAMYHETFEKDTDLQKWDSGCWIRYKMFENKIEEAPTVDVLDKIRAEIEEYKSRTVFGIGIKDLETGKQVALDNVLAIIDKYRNEVNHESNN